MQDIPINSAAERIMKRSGCAYHYAYPWQVDPLHLLRTGHMIQRCTGLHTERAYTSLGTLSHNIMRKPHFEQTASDWVRVRVSKSKILYLFSDYYYNKHKPRAFVRDNRQLILLRRNWLKTYRHIEHENWLEGYTICKFTGPTFTINASELFKTCFEIGQALCRFTFTRQSGPEFCTMIAYGMETIEGAVNPGND